MPAEAIADMEGLCRCEIIAPAAQSKAEPRRISAMSGAIGAVHCESAGSMNSATPTRPGTRAAKVIGFGRSSAEIASLMRTIQNGIVANMTAANPEETLFSS